MPRRYTSATERRERDREIRRLSANREIGRRHPYATLLGMDVAIERVMTAGVVLVVAASVAALMWWKVDHKTIGFVAAAGGIALTLAYVANLIGTSGLQRRMMAKANGRPVRPVWWHGVGAAGAVLLTLAFVVIPR